MQTCVRLSSCLIVSLHVSVIISFVDIHSCARPRSFVRSLVRFLVRSLVPSFVRPLGRPFVRSFVCFLVSFSLRSFVYSVYLFHCFHSLTSWPLHPSLSSLSPISDCLSIFLIVIPFFFHRLETCPIPAVFDSTGPVREMFENFAPQVKPTERHSIPKVPQSRCTGTSVILLRNSSNIKIRLRKTVVLTNKKKVFCDLIWKIRTVVRFRVVLKPIHSNLVWGAKIEKKTESSHFDLITTLATQKTLIEGVLGLLRPGRSFVHKWSCLNGAVFLHKSLYFPMSHTN